MEPTVVTGPHESLDLGDDFVDTDTRTRTGSGTDTDTGVAQLDATTEVTDRPPAAERPALTEREERILAFERQWWRHAGAKEQAIRDTFGLSATRYYQLLNRLLDNPLALERDPVLVRRLRRLRAARARVRARIPRPRHG
ncbi:MAG: DUF3263 domain-containing protein [Micromonosporaceae bacterium]